MLRRPLYWGSDTWYPILEKGMYISGGEYTGIQVFESIRKNQRQSRYAGWGAR
jgi:hypothetical protein